MTERRVWRVSEGEEAQLTPGGPTAAAIVSRAPLPLRPRRSTSGPQRPGLAGTYVVLGDIPYQVVSEQATAAGMLYLLDPWPPEEVIRDQITYGAAFVQPVLFERESARERARRARVAWPLYPLLGLLPEERQLLVCEYFGLDAIQATFVAGLVEAGTLLLCIPLLQNSLVLLLLAALLGVSAVLRAVGALVMKEVGGSPLVVLAFGVGDAVRGQRWRELKPRRRLTRRAFWRQLQVPDRVVSSDEPGSLEVQGALPHLSWAADGRVKAGEDWWNVVALPPTPAGTELRFRYRLTTRLSRSALALRVPRAPAPTAYRDEVLAEVAHRWDELLSAGLRPLLALLPADVQHRVFDARGGPTPLRRTNLILGGLTVLAAIWFALGADIVNLPFGGLLLLDALQRLWRAQRGQYAPSLFGGLIAGYLPPERAPYHAHRTAVEQ
jgi:hypothetical protein